MHEGHRLRMRERFLKEGLDSFEPHQILELLLFYAIPRRDINEISHNLIKKFGNIAKVFEADVEDLMKVEGVGFNAAVMISLVPSLSRVYNSSKWGEKPVLNSTSKAGKYAITLFTGRLYETFFLLCLDSQNKMNYSALIHEGTIDEAPIYPRLIVEAALRHKAHSVILAHNHPGGSLLPSKSDIDATNTIVNALSLVNIRVVDHLIVAGEGYSSFVEIGLLKKYF